MSQETNNSNLFESVLKRSVKRMLNVITQHEESWLGWTGKLQVTLLCAYISRKKLCSQTFNALSEEVMVMYSEKIKTKRMKKDVWKSFFFFNLQAGVSQLHNRLTSSQTVFRYFKDTLMQIWKSAHIFVYIWKHYVQNFTLKHLLLFEICTRAICEKIVYKHSETTEYVKK